jgi:integrase
MLFDFSSRSSLSCTAGPFVSFMHAMSSDGPLDLKNIRTRNFALIVKAAGPDSTFRVYDLRHSTATLMLADGVNTKIVSERLGHASVALTLDPYSHALPDIQKDATTRLASMLYG